MESTKILIEPLDVDNYATWRIQMRFGLIARGQWDEAADEPAVGLPALALIGLCVKPHHLPMLDKCKTANEAWSYLAETYQAKSNARKLQLRQALTQLKMDPSEPLTKYVGRAKELQAQLGAAGHVVEDRELVWYVLAGLPSGYETIVTVLETSAEELTPDGILPKLLQVEQRQRKKEEVMEKALSVKTSKYGSGSNQTNGNGGNRDRVCWSCGEKGHVQRFCPKRNEKHHNNRGGPKSFTAIAL